MTVGGVTSIVTIGAEEAEELAALDRLELEIELSVVVEELDS